MQRITLFLVLMWFQVETVCAQWDFVRIDEGIKPALALGTNCTAEIGYMLEANDGFVRHAEVPLGGMPVITPIDEGYFYGPLDIETSIFGDVFIAYHDHDVEDQKVAIRSGGAWNIERVSDPGHDGWDNSIAITEGGIVHTSSIDPSGFSGRGVEHARRSVSGFWTVEHAGSPSIMYANATSIVLNENDDPAIAYFNDVTSDLELAVRTDGIWSTSIVDSAGLTGRFPSMQMDAAGNLHIAYYKGIRGRTGVIQYAKQDAGEWTITTVDTLRNVLLGFTGARRNVALEIENEDMIHLVYSDRDVLKYARGIPDNWVFETIQDVSSSEAELGQQVDMERCGDDGSVHMVYYRFDSIVSPEEIWYVRSGIPVGVEEVPEEFLVRIAVYPNPASSSVSIQIIGDAGAHNESAKLEIFDALGRSVFARSMHLDKSSDKKITLQGLAAGAYLVRLTAADHQHVSSFVVGR